MSFNPSADPFRLRFGLENAGGGVSGEFELYLQKNSGSYGPITTTSTDGIRSYDASSSADNTAILIPRLTLGVSPWWLTDAVIDLDFTGNRVYPSGAFTDYLSCSRASIGYAKNADGTLTQFSTDTLRIGVGTGLLVEDARTNIVTQSQSFNDAAWNAENIVTVSADATTAPDGTTTADKIIPSTTNTFHRITNSSPGTLGAGSRTWSVYAKAAGYSWIALVQAAGTNVANFDLANGVVGTVTASTTATIEALGSGWYRCVMTGTLGVSVELCRVPVNNADGGTVNGCATYAGDGTSGVYLWGASLEEAGFVSSYIPTTTTSAVRAADVVSFAGNLATIFATGVLSTVVDCIAPNWTTGYWRIVVDDTGSSYTYLTIKNDSANAVSMWTGGAQINADLGNSQSFLTGAKVGYCQNDSGRSIVGGGGTVGSDSEHFVLSGPRIGYGPTAATYFYGYFRRLTVWNSRLADAALQGLTVP